MEEGMKKILLIMMMVMGTAAYGRDFEYNGKRDVERYIQGENGSEPDRYGRFTCGEKDREFGWNLESCSRFHRELETQYRGHQGR